MDELAALRARIARAILHGDLDHELDRLQRELPADPPLTINDLADPIRLDEDLAREDKRTRELLRQLDTDQHDQEN